MKSQEDYLLSIAKNHFNKAKEKNNENKEIDLRIASFTIVNYYNLVLLKAGEKLKIDVKESYNFEKKPLFFIQIRSSIVFLVPGIIITSASSNSFGVDTYITSISDSQLNGSKSVKFEILGNLIILNFKIPLEIEFSKDNESSEGIFRLLR